MPAIWGLAGISGELATALCVLPQGTRCDVPAAEHVSILKEQKSPLSLESYWRIPKRLGLRKGENEMHVYIPLCGVAVAPGCASSTVSPPVLQEPLRGGSTRESPPVLQEPLWGGSTRDRGWDPHG